MIGILRSHRSNDLFNRPERPSRLCEILDIRAGTVENSLRFVIRGVGFLVTGNDNPGMKTLDHINARDPLVPLSRSSECEHWVDLIVSDITRDDGIERRDVEHGTRRDIALSDLKSRAIRSLQGR
jgi:hypothetical protein